ncbi:U2 snRNP component prp10 [Spathaspora sp. JA1]|nr:U2 snRNP component prp10 [Spathaspora sp. JA1]
MKKQIGNYSIPQELNHQLQQELDATSTLKQTIVKNDYQRKRYNQTIDLSQKSYKQKMQERNLEREEQRVDELIKQPDGIPRKRKKRWDVTPEEYQKQKELDSQITTSSDLLDKLKSAKVPVINGIPLTDEILDKILPPGYIKVSPPIGFKQVDGALPPDITTNEYYTLPSNEDMSSKIMTDNTSEIPGVKGLDFFKPEDMKYFGKLINEPTTTTGSSSKDINAMKLILKVKNGSQITRKRSMRSLTDNATKYGPNILLNQILPILLEPNLDSQERHILVKLLSRLLFQFDDQIRPYTHQILQVISPLLIDEDSTIRLEAREIISSLTKAAGLANILATLRPDLDNVDEYIRNLTARVFSIVANTLGIKTFLPFLKAVIKSKKNWTARHTGIKIIQQLCIMLGNGNGSTILPYLTQLIEMLKPTITDESLQVRTMTALTLSQLAQNVSPYGIESFESILEPIWFGIRKHRGKALASFLNCIGNVIPLMYANSNYEEFSNYYTRELVHVLAREFNSPDEDMKKTILRILVKLPLSRKLNENYNREIIKPFISAFWNRRTASDTIQTTRLVVEATTHLANKFDFLALLDQIVIFTKDDNEQLRKLAIETINKMISNFPSELIGLDSQSELQLIDGIVYAFQEQTIHHKIYLDAFESLSKALNTRLKPHLNSIISLILYRMKNNVTEIRQQSTDLLTILAPVIKQCSDTDELLCKLILILYESLGEVFPEVLASIITALYTCLDSVDKSTLYIMTNPSINQILPTLTPILKNRQEKVQESCIKLIGLIATKNPETINAKEWMRICFELLELLKSTKKRIRIAANDTFGHIAKTIGPQDVIVMLLNNLRVQERQLRVCTAVAMGIVAETCSPFTVLPAIMNEYRIPEKNVQNGVLKAISFLFEYLDGNTTKDYLFAITPLLEDALIDRDLVHRQTAATVIKHVSLNCIGLTNSEYDDIFIHYLNLILPNIYESSPHVIQRILESLDGLRNVLGLGVFMNYIWAGLFHPARKVRAPYWKVFNSAYIQNSDALVPYYPRFEQFPGENEVNVHVEELDLFL